MKILLLLIIAVSCLEATCGFQVIELFQVAQAQQAEQLTCINSIETCTKY